jgi:hypothetical protein
MTANKAAPHYPWDPLLGKGPRLHNFSYGAVSGKPLVVYETSFFMPYPYRSEWGGMMLGLAASQDWDAVYFYVYGEPWLIYRGTGADADYGRAPLPIPTGRRADYTHGYHHGGDEVAIASWTAAGLGFINGGLEPAEKPAIYHFGASHLYGLPPGYCAGAQGCGKGNKLLIFDMYDASLAGRLRLAFDGKSDDGGRCEPCVPAATGRRIQAGKNITWDMENVRAVFDSPTYKAVIGSMQGEVTFAGGIRVDFRKPVFGSFALLAADGQPIAQSSDIRMVMSGSSQNTGFVLDPEKIDFNLPYGAITGVTDPGRAPVVAIRPEADVAIPGWRGKMERFDFTLRRYAQSPVNESAQFSADEPFFYGRLTP